VTASPHKTVCPQTDRDRDGVLLDREKKVKEREKVVEGKEKDVMTEKSLWRQQREKLELELKSVYLSVCMHVCVCVCVFSCENMHAKVSVWKEQRKKLEHSVFVCACVCA
jgi:hypothetical protein